MGTTSVRTLESMAHEDGVVHPAPVGRVSSSAQPYRFWTVDRLATNFHLPRSTLLMLISAFAGYEPVMEAYRESAARWCRFCPYGDAMLLLYEWTTTFVGAPEGMTQDRATVPC